MRALIAAAFVGLVGGSVSADDPKPAPVKPAPVKPADKKDDAPKAEEKSSKLKVGDPAPPLTVDKWLQGDEVKAFAAGKVYVVEFWATWCGPCIVMMPHMAEMQAEYRDKGVTFIGFTSKGPNNSLEKVTEFVSKRGPKLKYTFAYEDEKSTNTAYMKAAGQNGIPCSFVVDRAGRVAYIGHPMYLDEVIPKVVAGTWKNEESAEELKKIEEEVDEVFQATAGKDAEAGLKTLTAFEAKHPGMGNIPYFVGPKLSLLVKTKKFDDALKMAEGLIAKAVKQDDAMTLRNVSTALRSPAAKGEKALAEMSLKAAEAGLKLAGEKDAIGLLAVAESHLALDDKAKAKEYADKAVAAAENESAGLKNYVKNQAKKFDDKKDDKKKDDEN